MKDRLKNCPRLQETKKTTQLNKIWDHGLDEKKKNIHRTVG